MISVGAILLLLFLGLVLTVKGGDLFVGGAVWIAEASGLPRFLIGATVVSLATTLPELAVSLMAAGRGSLGIAAGNAVGSVSANLGLILGLCLLLASPAPSAEGRRGRLALMAGAAALLLLLCARGRLGAVGAAALLGVCAAFLLASVREGRARLARNRERRPRAAPRQVAANAARFVAGAAGIALGARLLSDCGAILALLLGVPDGVVGATLVAVGTSLPELATAMAALSRGEAGLSVGNVVGANIIDLTLILPLCAVTGGSLPLPRQSLALDMPFCLALCLIAVLPPLRAGRFYRWQGAALPGLYALYLWRVVAGLL